MALCMLALHMLSMYMLAPCATMRHAPLRCATPRCACSCRSHAKHKYGAARIANMVGTNLDPSASPLRTSIPSTSSMSACTTRMRILL